MRLLKFLNEVYYGTKTVDYRTKGVNYRTKGINYRTKGVDYETFADTEYGIISKGASKKQAVKRSYRKGLAQRNVTKPAMVAKQIS